MCPQAGTSQWNGRSWQQVFPATIPPNRLQFAMAFDASSARVGSFGGQMASGLERNTWAYDARILAPASFVPAGRRSVAPRDDSEACGPMTRFGDRATKALEVPPNSGLVGRDYWLRALVIDVGAPGGAALRNAGHGRIGAR